MDLFDDFTSAWTPDPVSCFPKHKYIGCTDVLLLVKCSKELRCCLLRPVPSVKPMFLLV